MPKTSEVRNGESEVLESRSDPAVSPDKKMDAAKMVMFRSKDRELTLIKKAGYTEKSHGVSSYVPTDSVQFVDFLFMVADKPENRKVIEFLRNHPSNGISFREVPVDDVATVKPSIADLEAMTSAELRETCEKRGVEIKEDASREQIILAILKK